MLARSPRFCLAPLTLAFALALLGGGCDKDKSNPPGGGGGGNGSDGGGAGAPAEGGEEYVYAEGFTLTANTKIKLELSSSQGTGAAELEARSLIEATPEGGKLKVHGKVVELINYTGSGQLDPEFMRKQAEEQGEEAIDIVAELGKSEAWMVIDDKGEGDEDASKALAENQGETDEAPVDFGLFSLPDLPAVDLEVGKKVQLPTKADERMLPFGPVPVEVDVTWTLRSIEGNIAELDVSSESSGATEFEGGGGTALVSILGESSYTVFFNVETKLPVSFNGYSASEINVDAAGQAINFATNNEIATTFEAGAAAPAGDAPAPAPAPAPAEDAAVPAEG